MYLYFLGCYSERVYWLGAIEVRGSDQIHTYMYLKPLVDFEQRSQEYGAPQRNAYHHFQLARYLASVSQCQISITSYL